MKIILNRTKASFLLTNHAEIKFIPPGEYRCEITDQMINKEEPHNLLCRVVVLANEQELFFEIPVEFLEQPQKCIQLGFEFTE